MDKNQDFEIDYSRGAPAAPAPERPPHDGEDRDRAVADEALARESGFAPKDPVYAIGTPVNELGVANFKRSRQDFDKLPTVEQAMRRLGDKVRAEAREDWEVHTGDLKMDPTGKLAIAGTPVDISLEGFKRLASLVTPGGAAYLAACPPDKRADHFNHWLAQDGAVRVLRVRHVGKGKDRQPVIFSAVSTRYKPFDADQLADAVVKAAPPDAKCDVEYKDARVKASILWHTNVNPAQAVAGEFFKAGVVLRSADDGSHSVKIDAELWRNLCLNLIILDCARQSTMRKRHLIDEDEMSAALGIGFNKALEKVGGFAEKWDSARLDNIIERYALQPDVIFDRLVRNRVVTVPGIKAEDLIERLNRAWLAEPGYSKADIVNAITRAAHESPWERYSATEELEEQAGQLLYARVWDVADRQIELD